MMATIADSDVDLLLAEIDVWCGHTGQTPGRLGQMVLNHGGFVPLLRMRGSLRAETAERIRAFMAAFPDTAHFPARLTDALLHEAKVNAPWTPARHGPLLRRLGFAALLAAGTPTPSTEPASAKPKVSAAVIRAAKLDGRDLPTFVTALIDMGLECWRDDRREHGEPVA